MKSTKPTDLRSDRSRPRKSHTKQNRKAVTFWHQGLGVIWIRKDGEKAVLGVPFQTEKTCRRTVEAAEEHVNRYRQASAQGRGYEPLALVVERYDGMWIYREETT